jgi:hypothetical protein
MVSMHTRVENLIADMNRQLARDPNNGQFNAVKKNLIELGGALRAGAGELCANRRLNPASQRALIEAQDMLIKLSKF